MLQFVENKLYSALGAAIHDKSQKQLFTGQEESQDNPFGFLGRMNGIHFCKRVKTKILKIRKHAPFKDSTVLDLCLMYLTWFNVAEDLGISLKDNAAKKIMNDIDIQKQDRMVIDV